MPDLIAHPRSLYVGGEWAAPATDATITVLDSATEEPFEVVAEAREPDVDRAVAAAREAFDEGPWPRMTHDERAEHLRRLADELDARSDQHARIWTGETGILLSAAKASTATFSGTYRYYASLAESFEFLEQRPSESGGTHALIVREPVGVVAAIVAWNGAPGLISTKVAPALLAGCTVIVKASPEAPGPAYILAEACDAAGLPPGVVNILTADRQASEHLVRHAGVDKIAFTGSTAAGRRIASICTERMARFTLELGGKSPALVLDDYDVEAAAKSIASRAVLLTGQVCFSLTRVIVSRDRHDAMVDALAASFGRMKVGDPTDPESQMGPLATAVQRERVGGYVAAGVADGATLACGGRRPPDLPRGYYFEPTVFGNVDNASTIGSEEIFGPVLSVIPVADEAEGLRVANDTIYGLNASVFTNDADRAWTLARRLRAGVVGQNAARREHRLPFGGFKQSGIGREGGEEGLLPYLETKVIVLDGEPSGPISLAIRG